MMDNCGPQNKNWTVFSGLVSILNSAAVNLKLKIISLNYFEAGHTFMSADSFHAKVEGAAKDHGSLYDYDEFVKCVQKVGIAICMERKDFLKWENQLSQKKASKESRPLLDNVVVAEFRKGSSLMFYKESHNDADFKTADFLKLKVLKQIENGDNILPQKVPTKV